MAGTAAAGLARLACVPGAYWWAFSPNALANAKESEHVLFYFCKLGVLADLFCLQVVQLAPGDGAGGRAWPSSLSRPSVMRVRVHDAWLVPRG